MLLPNLKDDFPTIFLSGLLFLIIFPHDAKGYDIVSAKMC